MTADFSAEQRFALQDRVARVIAEAPTLDHAIERLLATIGSQLDWPIGMYWHRPVGSDRLRVRAVWHAEGSTVNALAAASHAWTFRRGEGFPGRVWQARRPLWLANLAADDLFVRGDAALAVGVRGAFAFPVASGDELLGVMEFFQAEASEPDAALVALCEGVGAQIAAFAERDRGERAIRESEALKTGILESALDSIVTMDEHGKISEFNPAAVRMFGYTRDEAIGRSLADTIIPPSYRDAHHRGMARYLVTGEQSVLGRRIEVSAIRKDGSEFPCELAITRLPLAGPPSFAGYIRDLTERRRAETAMRFVAETSVALASSLDYRATLVDIARLAVPAICDWCVVELLEGDQGLRPVAAVHRDAASVARILQVHADCEGAVASYCPRRVARTGITEWVPDVASSAPAAHDLESNDALRELQLRAYVIAPLTLRGASFGTITFANSASSRALTDADRILAEDIGRRASVAIENARLFEESERARDSGEVANRARTEFLAMISHELRTPLNAIGGYSQLLEMGLHGDITDAQRDALSRISRNQEHLLGLINNILNFAKVEAGRVQFDLVPTRVSEVVAGLEALIHPQVLAKQLTFEVQDGHPAACVVADAEKMRQVLVNLLSNAVKFTDTGGRVTLQWAVAATTVAICVSDTGVGIPAARVRDIFEPFVQVNAALTRESEGVGLGLAISREIARAMSGELSVESEPGKGSAFTFTLPRAADAASVPRASPS